MIEQHHTETKRNEKTIRPEYESTTNAIYCKAHNYRRKFSNVYLQFSACHSDSFKNKKLSRLSVSICRLSFHSYNHFWIIQVVRLMTDSLKRR